MHRLVRFAVLSLGVLGCAVLVRAQVPASAHPSSVDDERASLGSELFAGLRALENRGPACSSCHEVPERASIESRGPFGPGLARAYGRLGGARHVSDWLTRPAAPLMHTTYTSAPLSADEVRALTAYLEKIALGTATLPRRSRGGVPAAP